MEPMGMIAIDSQISSHAFSLVATLVAAACIVLPVTVRTDLNPIIRMRAARHTNLLTVSK
jgi:hypothetical protein